MNKNSFYFDHDYSARNDQKILKLRAKYGLEGYGFFWCLIESMAEDSTGYIDGSAIDVLSLSYGIAIDKTKEIIDYMISIQLIEKCEHGNYYNNRINEHKRFRDERSRSGKKGAVNRWKNQSVNSSANSSANAKDRKGKDRIVKERIKRDVFIPPSFEVFENYCKENGFPSIAERAFKYYADSNWKDSQGKPVISWKGKLQAVWFKQENRENNSDRDDGFR